MRRIIFTLIMGIIFLQVVSALNIYAPSDIYMDVNTTYQLILVPLDENVYNITLNVNDGGNWTTLNFTWTGEQYQLNILFTEVGDYPFVINTTEVEGEITGNFLVRDAYYITFYFFRDRQSYPFYSNRYINEMSYVTAELTGERTFFANNYDTNLEPFVAPLRLKNDNRLQKAVWYEPYQNGVATIKLYETGDYAIRLIDGQIEFDGEYAIPNISKSYGTNVYVGKYNFDGSDESYNVLLTDKDLHPYRWLLNWGVVIVIVCIVLGSVAMFFMIPEYPLVSFMFGVGFSILLLIVRLVIFIWKGI